MKAFSVNRSRGRDNTDQIKLIDAQGRKQRPGHIPVLGYLRNLLEHDGVVLIDKAQLVAYLDPRQAEWLVRQYMFESSEEEFQKLPQAERVQLVAQAWQRGREWYSSDELQQIAAQECIGLP
jgi:hypothetical protein